MKEQLYMHINTGSVDTLEGFQYRDEDGKLVQPEPSDDLIPVVKVGDWYEEA